MIDVMPSYLQPCTVPDPVGPTNRIPLSSESPSGPLDGVTEGGEPETQDGET
jgi:hypothetical protein